MHNSTPPRWKRSKSKHWLSAALLAASFAAPAGALEPTDLSLGDPHLNVLPRGKEDADRIKQVTAPATNFTTAEPYELLPAGAATVRARRDDEAFSQHSANLTFEQELEFKLGNGLFKKIWVFSPSSTRASDGLGPLYNARSCQRCHIKDGRGHVPEEPDYTSASMFLRISIPGPVPTELETIQDYIGTLPEPTYGGQNRTSPPRASLRSTGLTSNTRKYPSR